MLKISRGLGSLLTRIALNHTTSGAAQRTQTLHTARVLNCEKHQNPDELAAKNSPPVEEERQEPSAQDPKLLRKDRTKIIPVETSIRYLQSTAYLQTYGNHLVWEQYRRNHKGLIPPRKTRKTCIRKGVVTTGNPCPICRDEYLVLDYRNIELLKQFISSQTGQVLSFSKTGLCQKKHLELLVAVERAWDHGLLAFDVPSREFDYSEFYRKQVNS